MTMAIPLQRSEKKPGSPHGPVNRRPDPRARTWRPRTGSSASLRRKRRKSASDDDLTGLVLLGKS